MACSDYDTVEVRHAAPLGAGALYPKTTHETLANLTGSRSVVATAGLSSIRTAIKLGPRL